MNKKIIVGLMIISVLLLTGCVDQTERACSLLKNTNAFENVTTYMDGGICIRETKDYVYTHMIECNSLTASATMILKTIDPLDSNILDDMPKHCKITGFPKRNRKMINNE